jgi:hypothetical protein
VDQKINGYLLQHPKKLHQERLSPYKEHQTPEKAQSSLLPRPLVTPH